MLSTARSVYRTFVKSFAMATLAALAACSGDTNPVRDTLVAVGAGPKTAESPDFVARSRPATLEYLPVGAAAPARPTAARTADEVKAAEAELDAVRARNEAAAQTAVQAGDTPAPEAATAPTRRKPVPPQAQ
jgi:hypothetical protein